MCQALQSIMSLVRLGVLAIPVLAVYLGVLLARPEFKVHSSGGVLITGASSGIGEDAARKLVELGYDVFAAVRNEAASELVKV
jgi:hypothetical protein